MSEADDLARRYFALWADYLSALVSDPQAADLLQRWIAFAGQFAKASGERVGDPFPIWPPIPTAAGTGSAGPQAPAAAAAGAPRQRDAAMDQLARRIDELERRLAALERQPKARRPRPGNRTSGE